MMVQLGLADGMVSGAAHTTAHTIRPALRDHQDRARASSIVSSVFFMCLADQVLVYGDCAVNPDPDRRAARRHRDLRRRATAARVRRRAAGRDAVLLDRHLRHRRRRRQGARGHRAGARAARRTCWSRARSSTTPRSTPRVAAHQAARTRRSPGGRPCSSSPTSTPATTPTRRCSARPARSRSARSCRACASRSTTCPAARWCSDIVNTVAITAIQAAGDVAGRRDERRPRSWCSTPAPRR